MNNCGYPSSERADPNSNYVYPQFEFEIPNETCIFVNILFIFNRRNIFNRKNTFWGENHKMVNYKRHFQNEWGVKVSIPALKVLG